MASNGSVAETVWTFGNTTIESTAEGDSNVTSATPVGETLVKDHENAQVQLRTDLLQNISSLVNNSDFGDFKFVCSDGIQVKASKLLLKGRSPVFDNLFTGGMRESLQSAVNLPEISSAVMLYLLDILYAGDSVHHPLVNWQMGLEAIKAADYFLLPNVIKIVRKFLWAEVEQVVMDRDVLKAASMLTVAMEVSCIVHGEGDYYVILIELVSLLYSSWMQIGTQLQWAVNLSESALGYVLRITKPRAKPDLKEGASLEEYFRVRAVVQWCVGASQENMSIEAERLVDSCMPSRSDHLYRLDCGNGVATKNTEIVWLPNHENFDAQDGKLCGLLSKKDCRNAIARLLEHTNWQQIPVAVLVKILEPLQILPSLEYGKVMGNHALCRDVKFDLRCRLKWIHDPSCDTESRGFRVFKRQNGTGRAICLLGAHRRNSVLRWCFLFRIDDVVEEIHFGLARAKPSVLFGRATNGAKSTENFTFHSLMTARSSGDLKVHVKPHGKVHFEIDKSACIYIAVETTFNQETRLASTLLQDHRGISCHFTLPGKEDVFPATDLGSTATPQVDMAFVRGFGFF